VSVRRRRKYRNNFRRYATTTTTATTAGGKKKIGERKRRGKKITTKKKKSPRVFYNEVSKTRTTYKVKFVVAREYCKCYDRRNTGSRWETNNAVAGNRTGSDPRGLLNASAAVATTASAGGFENGRKTNRPPSRACPGRRRTPGPPPRGALRARNSRPYPPPPRRADSCPPPPPPDTRASGYRRCTGDGLWVIGPRPLAHSTTSQHRTPLPPLPCSIAVDIYSYILLWYKYTRWFFYH